jgi:HPt (histidine-containing phosphotransfer) domain-containing protein
MDDYIPKPIRPTVLFEALGRCFGGQIEPPKVSQSPPADNGQPVSADAGSIDWTFALASMAGDEELLCTVGDTFLQESEAMLRRIREAINRGDAHALDRAGHTLKGALVHFGAPRPLQLALEMEHLGKTNNLAVAAALFAELDAEMVRFNGELAAKVGSLSSASAPHA